MKVLKIAIMNPRISTNAVSVHDHPRKKLGETQKTKKKMLTPRWNRTRSVFVLQYGHCITSRAEIGERDIIRARITKCEFSEMKK